MPSGRLGEFCGARLRDMRMLSDLVFWLERAKVRGEENRTLMTSLEVRVSGCWLTGRDDSLVRAVG